MADFKGAPRNRTLRIDEAELRRLRKELSRQDAIVCGDAFERLPGIESNSFDLLFADPPYNLTKEFGGAKFSRRSSDEYEEWLDGWLRLCVPLLKETASVYICGDWRSSAAIERAGSRCFSLRNRITWERKGSRS